MLESVVGFEEIDAVFGNFAEVAKRHLRRGDILESQGDNRSCVGYNG